MRFHPNCSRVNRHTVFHGVSGLLFTACVVWREGGEFGVSDSQGVWVPCRKPEQVFTMQSRWAISTRQRRTKFAANCGWYWRVPHFTEADVVSSSSNMSAKS